MNRDYETLAYISWNLEDAIEQLTEISEMITPNAEIDEGEFNVKMADLYGHLNTAWNIRHLNGDDLSSADGKQLDLWKRFPADLNPL